ncbi:MAG: DUF1122 family protein [Desulfurococcales archaeon]|nr:DUF1122 family protein [Desulfurococcales archaeon]
MNLETLVSRLDGLRLGDYSLSLERLGRGGIRETLRLRLVIRDGGEETVLYLLVFLGRGELYKAWIEVFGARRQLRLGKGSLVFPGSQLEARVLDAVSASLGPGERLFIEYLYDEETMRALELGVPAPATRLGYELFTRGFRWFKDWYFPEGFMEGGPKLQAEKPLGKRHEERLLAETRKELEEFIEAWRGSRNPVITGALERAKRLLAALG